MTEAENEYVIRGNAAIVRCKIPSFVSDFVHVENWIMDDGQILTINNTNAAEGIFFIQSIKNFFTPYPVILLIILDCNKTNLHLLILVVSQSYEAEADNEYVIRGNAAIMKCEVPSFVSDFVSVEMWTDSDGGTYYPGNNEGILPHYDIHIP